MAEEKTLRDVANAIIGMERIEDTEEAFEQLEHAAGLIEDFARSVCEKQREADKKEIVEFIPKWLRGNGSTRWDEDTMLMNYHEYVKDKPLVV